MSSHRERRAVGTEEFSSGDGLGRLIRWTLRESVGREEPSPRVWDKISRELERERAESAAGQLKGPVRARSAVLAQTVVLVMMLLVFSFGVDETVRVSSEMYQPTPTVRTIEARSSVGTDLDDMLSGWRLNRSAKQLTFMDYRLAPFVECPR